MDSQQLFRSTFDTAADEILCIVPSKIREERCFGFEFNQGDIYTLARPRKIQQLVLYIRQFVFEHGGDEFEIMGALNFLYHSARRSDLEDSKKPYVFWFHGAPTLGEVSLKDWLKEQGYEIPELTHEDVRLS